MKKYHIQYVNRPAYYNRKYRNKFFLTLKEARDWIRKNSDKYSTIFLFNKNSELISKD